MSPKARQVLADNLNRLIDLHAGKGRRSVRAWAIAKKIDPKVVQRALGVHGPTLETLQGIADGVGVEPWQLLVENLNPALPPRIEVSLSSMAFDLAQALDKITDEAQRRRAYALALGVVEMGGQSGGPPDEPPIEPPPPAPDGTAATPSQPSSSKPAHHRVK